MKKKPVFYYKINKNISKYNAFTLIELLVGITIIGILALGMNNLNINAISNKQKLEIFTNKLTAEFENIRNNSLLGKGTLSGTTLINPEKWKMEFSLTGSGKIISSYYDNSNWTEYSNFSFTGGYILFELECLNLDETNSGNIIGSYTGTIFFKGGNLSLTGSAASDCYNVEFKKLNTTIKYKEKEKTFQINTLNGLVQEIKN